MSVFLSPITFATLLRTMRHERQLSQSQLAEAAGYDRSYLSYLERSQRHPTRDVVLKLAQVMQLGPEETDRLLVSARFAAQFHSDQTNLDLTDPLIHVISQTLQSLDEPRRSLFRSEMLAYIGYWRSRLGLSEQIPINQPHAAEAEVLR